MNQRGTYGDYIRYFLHHELACIVMKSRYCFVYNIVDNSLRECTAINLDYEGPEGNLS
nr:hypothetical protein Q903MT_gene2638 [Picea sitchensis]